MLFQRLSAILFQGFWAQLSDYFYHHRIFCELLVCVGALAAYILWIGLIPLIFYSFKKGIYFLAIS